MYLRQMYYKPNIVQEISADFEDNHALLDTIMKLGTNIELGPGTVKQKDSCFRCVPQKKIMKGIGRGFRVFHNLIFAISLDELSLIMFRVSFAMIGCGFGVLQV